MENFGWDEVRAEFRRLWGYEDFRPPQGEIVRSLLAGQDALVVLPTGGGKSVCFQLPALLQSGLTLVISPLVALMENQVQELRDRRLPAASLHGELPRAVRKRVLEAIAARRLRLLYLSPETLLSPPVWERLSAPDLQLNGLILDEAHCLVQWGETFRPAYRRLGAVRPALLQHKPPGTKIAIAAFTATADPRAQAIVRETLQLDRPELFVYRPDRPNLALQVQTVWTPRGRKQQLLGFIRQREGKSGLVYVRSRRDSEELAHWLQGKGFSAVAYHAGLSAVQRREIEANWLSGKNQFAVCTSAFGMGVNKPDVRWVVHYQAPQTLPEYVQEVGRGGRDGQLAEAMTLASEPTGFIDPFDKQRREFFQTQLRQTYRTAQQLAPQIPLQGEVAAIAGEFPKGAIALSVLHSLGLLAWDDPFHYRRSAQIPERAFQELPALKEAEEMVRYLRTKNCRWQFLLAAFGFTEDAKNFRCGKCDNCLS